MIISHHIFYVSQFISFNNLFLYLREKKSHLSNLFYFQTKLEQFFLLAGFAAKL
jgi:hypothetical protein